MSKVSFNKPALTYQQQVNQLLKRGLIIDNVERVSHLLESINYYRLSGYWYPLLVDKSNHIFKEGANFNNAFEMYSFDRALRVLVIRELEKIEISIRAKMMYILVLSIRRQRAVLSNQPETTSESNEQNCIS